MFQGTGRKVCVLIKGSNCALKKHGELVFEFCLKRLVFDLGAEGQKQAPCPGEEENTSTSAVWSTSGGVLAHQGAEEPGQT